MKKRVLSLLTVAMVLFLLPSTTVAALSISEMNAIEIIKNTYGELSESELRELLRIPTGSYSETKKTNDFIIENGVLTRYQGKGGDVVIPDGITSIGKGVFADCKNMISITIPNSVTSIGESAFSWCTGLTSVTIPASVTRIEKSVFDNCTALTSVTIPNSVTSIGNNAFTRCSNLTSVTIPNSVTSIEAYAFFGCTSLQEITIPDGVTSICDGTFRGCTALKKVILPDTVTEIGGSAFADCSSLEELELPQGLTSLGGWAFHNAGIKKLTIPSTLQGYQLKSDTLEEVVISEGTTSLPYNHAFANCTALKKVTLPSTLTSIGNSTFENCTSLEEIELPQGLTRIGSSVFEGCTALKKVTLPSTLTNIAGSAFKNCSSLEKIEFPEGLTMIESCAYQDCTALKEITIPSTVQEILTKVFDGCVSLEKVTVFGNIEYYRKEDDIGNHHIHKYYSRDLGGLSFGNDVSVYYGEKQDTVFNQWAITAEATLEGVWNYVEPQSEAVTALSNEICNGLTSDYEKAKAIFDWMTANVAYDYEYYYGRKDTVITSAEGVMESKLTVCEGYAKLTKALLQAQGIPALYVVGKVRNAGHAWNVAYVDGKWIYLDSTWGRPGSRAENGESIDVGNYDPSQFDISVYSLANSRRADPITYGTYSVQASSSTVTVNGTQIGFECYNIGGNNYFKLRDLAAALNGSEKQFNVTWDGEKGAVNIVSNQAYEAVGGELTSGDGSAKNGQVNTASVYVDGYWVLLSGYNIGGNNFVKLRDLAKVLDFGVSWDGTTGTVVIDGNIGYTAE